MKYSVPISGYLTKMKCVRIAELNHFEQHTGKYVRNSIRCSLPSEPHQTTNNNNHVFLVASRFFVFPVAAALLEYEGRANVARSFWLRTLRFSHTQLPAQFL